MAFLSLCSVLSLIDMNPICVAGFSLIEVLVSLLLLSFILLGFDAAELYSLRAIRVAHYFSLASQQLHNMSERLLVAPDVASLEQQTNEWNEENREVLPLGHGEVSREFSQYRLVIYWGDKSSPCQQNQLGMSGCLIAIIYAAPIGLA